MAQPIEPMTAVSLVSLTVLCALALKKILVTDSFHVLRVVILTALLWAAVFYMFCLACLGPGWFDCVPPDAEDGHFTISGM